MFIDKALVSATAFAAGFALMGVEVFGVRMLTPYFGGAFTVWGAMISVVMAGLAAGYAVGGRLADKYPPRKLLPTYLAIAGTTTLLTPFATPLVGGAIANHIVDARIGALLAASLLFPIPTAAVGALTPALIKKKTDSIENVGNSSGAIQFLGTLGCIAGTLSSAFVLVKKTSSSTSMYIFATILLANAAAWIILNAIQKD